MDMRLLRKIAGHIHAPGDSGGQRRPSSALMLKVAGSDIYKSAFSPVSVFNAAQQAIKGWKAARSARVAAKAVKPSFLSRAAKSVQGWFKPPTKATKATQVVQATKPAAKATQVVQATKPAAKSTQAANKPVAEATQAAAKRTQVSKIAPFDKVVNTAQTPWHERDALAQWYKKQWAKSPLATGLGTAAAGSLGWRMLGPRNNGTVIYK